MGRKILAFSRLSQNRPDVFSPVNYRPTERCRTIVFDCDDTNRYNEIFDAEGIQFATGEVIRCGYHIIETPEADGPLIRYTQLLPDGGVLVKRHKSEAVACVYKPGEVHFVGFIFQFIRDFTTGERWEFIRGPAFTGYGEQMRRPLLEVSG